MHKCPHCGKWTISTLRKLMPGWSPRCNNCTGKWRTSYFPVLFFMVGPFALVPTMLFLATTGAVRPTLGLLFLLASAFMAMSLFLFYAMPTVKK